MLVPNDTIRRVVINNNLMEYYFAWMQIRCVPSAFILGTLTARGSSTPQSCLTARNFIAVLWSDNENFNTN